jgi:hypothetical protein
MPIRAELRKFYGREWRTVTRPRILLRASNKCEQCGKLNRRRVWVWRNRGVWPYPSDQYWSSVKGDGQRWHYCTYHGEVGNFRLFGAQWSQARRIRVVLTIAHLNHRPGDDKETRATRKDAARPLLVAAS